MNRKEIAKLIFVMVSAYPAHFKGADMDNLILAWQMTLEDYTYPQAAAGLKTYLKFDTKGFPPSPGQVVDCIHKLTQASKPEMTGMEAWSLVRKAIANSNYNSQAEFDKLPEAVQRAVGSPANLREMAALDKDQVETVEQSHFIRNYDAAMKRQAEDAKIPASVMELIKSADPQMIEA